MHSCDCEGATNIQILIQFFYLLYALRCVNLHMYLLGELSLLLALVC